MNAQHEALKKFSSQIEFAFGNYTAHGFKASDFSNVVIGGLGGSGIGGRIARSLFVNEFPIPIECIADYSLPHYVSEKTLAIIASYSGNTEETLQMYEDVKKKGCKTIILTSGGKLKDMATADGFHIYHMEPGFQPRMALGFSLTYLILLFGEMLGKNLKDELKSAAERVKETHHYEEDATQVFNSIKSRLTKKFVVVTDGLTEALGIRFCQQIQENAKHECFLHVIPEMNHNVIESYYGQMETVFFFIHSQFNERVSSRFDFLNNLLEVENNKIIPVLIDEYKIQAVYDTIHTLDWLSLYVADFRRVDSLNVPNIKSLKDFLDQV